MLALFGIRFVLMLVALFFLLRDGTALVDWFVGATPLAPERVREMMREFRLVARSVLGANFITAAAQAVVATIGFAIARAPSPIFFGLLCLFSSLIPSVGTALVTFPVAGLMLLLGHPWSALFLALWAAVAVGLIDNLLRPMLIRGEGQLHGALVFFSLIGAMTRVRRRGPVRRAARAGVLSRRRAYPAKRAGDAAADEMGIGRGSGQVLLSVRRPTATGWGYVTTTIRPRGATSTVDVLPVPGPAMSAVVHQVW